MPFLDLAIGPLATFCVALVPAAFVWWTGRTLAAAVDDPLLDERLLAARLSGRSVYVLAWAFLAVTAATAVRWWFPLMIVARGAAAYPLRRRIHGETWNIVEYLWFFGRFMLALFGFQLLLFWTPWLVGLTGRWDWAAAIAAACVLIAWHEWQPGIIGVLLRTTPVADAALAERLAALAARASVPAPRFAIVPMGGGVLANAAALPSRRGGTVLMTSTFVERFDHDEIVAVSAHEIAHLEHYSGQRLRRLNASVFAMIAAAAVVEPVARVLAPAAQPWVTTGWLVFVALYQALRVRSRQRNETASDLRAIELTGEPDTLARALIKLHAMGRVPRRWDAARERHASHPSLARRIKAIRDRAGAPPAVLEQPETFQSGATPVTLAAQRLEWSDGSLEHAVAYRQLAELRIDGSRSGSPRLSAVDTTGRRWRFEIASVDVPRVQRALDIVDVQLAEMAPVAMNAGIVRYVSLVTALVAFAAGQIAVLIPILLALARPSAALAAGAAAAALVSALLAWRDSLSIASGWAWWSATLAFCGAILLLLAWMGRKDAVPRGAWRPIALLSVFAVLSCLAVFASGTSAVRLHQNAHQSPMAIVLPVALAAALAWTRRAAVRRAAVPALLVAALVFGLGSKAYVESFSHDRFFAQGPIVTVEDLQDQPLTQASLPFPAATIRLSPDGSHIAVGQDTDDEEGPGVFHVGPPDGPFEPIECDDLFFLSDARILTVAHERTAVVLQERRAAQPQDVVRERRIAQVTPAAVTVDRSTSRWAVLGTGAGNAIVRIEGGFNEGAADVETRWPAAAGDSTDRGWVQPVAASRTDVLMRRSRYQTGPFRYGYVVASLLAPLTPAWTESEFWIDGSDGQRTLGTSGLNVTCLARDANGQPVCSAFAGDRTTLFALDLAGARLAATATIAGRFTGDTGDDAGWIAGRWEGNALALRAGGARAWRIRTGDAEWIPDVAANDHAIAFIGTTGTRSIIRTYRAPSGR
jgi:Zn-dependent protease with chaperone function